MKALWFLLWIPALGVFYLSIHDEFVRERRQQNVQRPAVLASHTPHHPH